MWVIDNELKRRHTIRRWNQSQKESGGHLLRMSNQPVLQHFPGTEQTNKQLHGSIEKIRYLLETLRRQNRVQNNNFGRNHKSQTTIWIGISTIDPSTTKTNRSFPIKRTQDCFENGNNLCGEKQFKRRSIQESKWRNSKWNSWRKNAEASSRIYNMLQKQ